MPQLDGAGQAATMARRFFLHNKPNWHMVADCHNVSPETPSWAGPIPEPFHGMDQGGLFEWDRGG